MCNKLLDVAEGVNYFLAMKHVSLGFKFFSEIFLRNFPSSDPIKREIPSEGLSTRNNSLLKRKLHFFIISSLARQFEKF